MRTSDLIKHLQEIVAEQGDLLVVNYCDGGHYLQKDEYIEVVPADDYFGCVKHQDITEGTPVVLIS